MGWPLATVNALTEQELSLWMVRGPMWPRRIELMLAQLTNVLANVNGNKTKMHDFDLFAARPESEAEDAANDIAEFTGLRVRKLGQGRAE